MKGYVDTSVLVKSYVYEDRSEEAIDYLNRLTVPIPLTPLLRLECTNAFQLKRFRVVGNKGPRDRRRRREC